MKQFIITVIATFMLSSIHAQCIYYGSNCITTRQLVTSNIEYIYQVFPSVTNPTWFAQNGTINGSTSGQSVNVTWSSSFTQGVLVLYQGTTVVAQVFVDISTPTPYPKLPNVTKPVICGDGMATFTASPGQGETTTITSYRWYDPNGTLISNTFGPVLNAPALGGSTYSVSAVNVKGEGPRAYTFTTVKPIPDAAIQNNTSAICSGETTSIVITNPNAVANTSFNWTVTADGIGGAMPGAGSNIAQSLTNNTSSPKIATYTVTPSANGCTGWSVSTQVTINPRPTAVASNQEICSGQTVHISINNPGGIENTVNSWTVSAPEVSGAAPGTGSSIDQTLVTSTLDTKNAVYTIVPVAGNCVGNPITVTVSVFPPPLGGITRSATTSLDKNIVYDNQIGVTTLEGHRGQVVAWQYTYTNDDAYYNNWGQEGQTTTTNTCCISDPLKTIWIRAKVQTASCVAYSTPTSYFWNYGNNYNYIKETTLQSKNVTESQVESVSNIHKTTRTTYFDDFGRQIQITDWQATPSGKDLVQTLAYDDFGREAFKYLPYASTENNGWYKPYSSGTSGSTYVNSVQYKFYNNGSPDKIINDLRPYARIIYESSPLNRTIKLGAEGSAWQPNQTNTYASDDQTTKFSYETNSAGEVLLWSYTYPSVNFPFGLIHSGNGQSPAYYTENQLTKHKTKDEHQNEVIEYTDKEGRVVLKKVQSSATEYALTYYVYDDFGQLVCVVPPEAVKNMLTSPVYFTKNDSEKDDFLKTWAFRYKYDAYKRAVEKQLPGAEPLYVIYDRRNRITLTQNGNQRALPSKEWTFTKYDALNRHVTTGTYVSNKTRDELQTDVDTFYETPAEGTAWHEIYVGPAAGNVMGYNNKSFPQVSDVSKYLTVTFYDSYDTFIAPLPGPNNEGYTPENQNLPGEVTGNQANVIGQITGTLAKNMNTGTWMRTVNYYDDKYRLIQTIADHQKDGAVRTSNVYDFTGKILHSQRRYTVGGDITTIREDYAYDHRGRQLSVTHTIYSGTSGTTATSPVTTVTNEYNELGQLVAKKLHKTGPVDVPVTADPAIGQPGVTYGSNIDLPSYNSSQHTVIANNQIRMLPGFHVPANSTFKARIGFSQQDADLHNSNGHKGFLQIVDYKYNIRNWLHQINDPSASGTDDLFNMELKYNTPSIEEIKPQYNGNISEVIWRSAGLDQQSYRYSYDNMNRLTEAKYVNTTRPGTHNGRYDEKVGIDATRPAYDLNGNIQNLLRKGKIAENTYGIMDDLHYDYTGNGNKLRFVSDAQLTNTQEEGFKEATDGEGTLDFVYDPNGNMIKDENKDIDIEYNYLNLPSKISRSQNDYIIYTYDAVGKKLSQQVFGTGAKLTEYIGELVYENNNLRFANHSEGRVIPGSTGMASTWEYQYHLKDHLGNVRLTFTSNAGTTTETASFEQANIVTEQSQFVRYANARRVQSYFVDRTNGIAPSTSPGYAQRLSGGTNEKYGLAKSISVMPGDRIKAEVYGKYIDPQNSNWSTALQALMTQVAAGGNGTTVVDGSSYSTATPSFPFVTQGSQNTASSVETGPKAYLNWLVFDREYNFKLSKSGFDRLSSAPKENGQDVAHEKLFSPEIVIDEPGYVYIYLSNEEGTPLEVYFDDFKVDHIKSATIQIDDYYPFGLTFNSSRRENSAENRYLYNQGANEKRFLTERVFDLGLSIDLSKYRAYDPATGKWWQADPLADNSDLVSFTPYNYSFNNPVRYNDPEGDCPSCLVGALIGGLVELGTQVAVNYVTGNDLTDIDWGDVGTSAVIGGVTSGIGVLAQTGKVSVRLASAATKVLKGTGEVAQAGVDVKMQQGEFKVKTAGNGKKVTDAAVEYVSGKVTGAASGKVAKTASEALNSAEKKAIQQAEKRITRTAPGSANNKAAIAKKAAAQSTIEGNEKAVESVTGGAGKAAVAEKENDIKDRLRQLN